MKIPRYRWAAAALVVASCALIWFVKEKGTIESRVSLSSEEASIALKVIRTVLSPGNVAPAVDEKETASAGDYHVIATLWLEGARLGRADGRASSIALAASLAAKSLAQGRGVARLSTSALENARIKIDILTGRGWLPSFSALARSVSVHPGLDGVGVQLGNAFYFHTIEDQLEHDMLTSSQPVSFIPDVKFGFNMKRAEWLFARASGLGLKKLRESKPSYFRFRSQTFLEPPSGFREELPTRLTRGALGPVESVKPSPETLEEAALLGGAFLAAHLADNGRYIYEVNAATGEATNPQKAHPYSLPRHAGTTYFLAELFRLTKQEFLKEPIERAFEHLRGLIAQGGCKGASSLGQSFQCVVDKGRVTANLGSSALAVVALVEYQRATGDSRYLDLAKELGEWMLFMQRGDGSFAHLYDIKSKTIDHETELLYFSGEAALALARLHEVTGDARYSDAAEAALDWLVDWYDFFLGGFFYAEDHWTCIAAEALSHSVQKKKYVDFCLGYGDFLRRIQLVAGDFPLLDAWAGSYVFTPFVPPQNTPVGSRTESMISTYIMAKRAGRDVAALRVQLVSAMGYALTQQIRETWNYWVPAKVRLRGVGGIVQSPVQRKIRIDYVQHVCSAMIRLAEILQSEQAAGVP